LPLYAVLEAYTLQEVHLKATDSLLNELSYKSPAEFAGALQSLLSVNLLECPAFHRYVELKATRDIHVHNRGLANDTYLKKSGSHARVARDVFLPVDIPYFLESYEACLQVTEWLEVELDQHWHSSEREAAKTPAGSPPETLLPTGPSDAVPPEVEQQELPAVVEAAARETKATTKGRRRPKDG